MSMNERNPGEVTHYFQEVAPRGFLQTPDGYFNHRDWTWEGQFFQGHLNQTPLTAIRKFVPDTRGPKYMQSQIWISSSNFLTMLQRQSLFNSESKVKIENLQLFIR